jgi:MFS family permease
MMSRRPLVAFLVAETISMVGTRMAAIALPWFVLATTGSAAKTGAVAFAELLPYVLASAFGGPLIDRLGAWRISVAADVASAVAVVAIPLLHERIGFGGVVAFVVVVGVLRGFGDTSKRAVFPRVVARSGMDMTRAASLNDGLARLSTLLGAPAGGLLIAAFDAPVVLAVDAATFAAAGLIVAFVVPALAAASEEKEPYLRALRAGLGFLRRDHLVAALILMLFFTNLFDSAYTAVLMPLWATEQGTAAVLGALFATFAIGAVLGNIVFTAVAPRAPRYALFTAGFLVGGAPRFVAVAFADTWVVFVVSFVAGLGIAAINPILGAVSYERIPERMMARVQGLAVAVAWAGMPLGALLGGWLADVAGLRAALLWFGGLYLLVTLAPLTHPMWRRLDDRPAAPDDRVAAPDERPAAAAVSAVPRPRERPRRAVPNVDDRQR